ncbi:MAG: hypothetical protein IPL13_17995 [Saprospiraceae bacterium]|nr:hypothetical protein [Candidatus Brachybacter algidus]
MKRILLLLMFAPIFLIGQTPTASMLSVSEITVKMGHEAQFIQGVKMYNECYAAAKGTDKWNIYRRYQGEGIVYLITSFYKNWVDMNKDDAASNSCRSIITNFIMPHMEKNNSMVAKTMPEVSKTKPVDLKMIWVTTYSVHDGIGFEAALTDFSNVIKTAEGDTRSYWFKLVGGSMDDGDYVSSVPFTGYEDMDIVRENTWKVYEKSQGKQKSDALRTKVLGLIENSWSYLYELKDDLSVK